MSIKQTQINVRSNAARLAGLALFFLAWIVLSRHSAAQQSELTSPNGQYNIRIVYQSLPHADPIYGDCTLVLSKRERAILKLPTTGYLINAFWSPDGKYVAVNNRRGNSGDYVWLLSLNYGRPLKKPDDESCALPRRKITQICPECDEGSFDKDLTIAKGWKSSNELAVETRWRFYKVALIMRHAVYKISGHRLLLVEEQVTKHSVDWHPPED